MPTTSVMLTRRGQFRALYRDLKRHPDLLATTPVVFCEGDSWFSTPLTMNALDWLVLPSAADNAAGVPVFGSGGLFFRGEHSGDLATEMFTAKRVRDLLDWYDGFAFDAVLLSGGGNDFVGEFLKKLFAKSGAMSAAAAFTRVVDSGRFAQVLAAYRRVLAAFVQARPGVPILAHTYDYPVLLGTPARVTVASLGAAALAKRKIGPWIQPHLAHVLDEAGQVDFARRLIDGFEARVLRPLRDVEFAGAFSYVDLRGTLRREDWFDEMHPTEAGFLRVADVLRAQLVAALPPAQR
jgi:hypothetical protein